MKLSRQGVLRMVSRAEFMARKIAQMKWQDNEIQKHLRAVVPDEERIASLNGYYNEGERLLEQCISLFRGNGFDLQINMEKSMKNPSSALYFEGDYHYMDENGMYRGYAGFKVEVTASLTSEFDVTVSRSKGWTAAVERKYYLKPYIEDSLYYWLSDEVDAAAPRVDMYWNTAQEEAELQAERMQAVKEGALHG